MNDKTNCAIRVKHIFEQAQRQAGKSQGTVWSYVFELEWNPDQLDSSLYDSLTLLNKEIDLIELKAQELQLPVSLYLTYLNDFRNVCNAANMNERWSDRGGKLHAQHFLSLAWLSHLIDSDGIEDTSAIDELGDELTRLKELVAANDYPDSFSTLFNRQIEIIQKALNGFKIRGADALADGIKETVAETIYVDVTLDDVNDDTNETYSSFKKSINALHKCYSKVADNASKVNSIGNVAEKGIKAIEFFSKLS